MTNLSNPCRVKTCPALSTPRSIYSYCPIHDAVATQPEMFEKALKGKLTAFLREFALDCERGYYPKTTW